MAVSPLSSPSPPSSSVSVPSLISSNQYYESIISLFDASIYVTTSAPAQDNAFDRKYKKGGNKESKDVKRRENKLRKRNKYSEEGLTEDTVGKKRKLEREQEMEEEEEEEGEEEDEQEEASSSSTRVKNRKGER